MSATGTLLVRTFISSAQLPISGAVIIVSVPSDDGRQKLISLRLSDRSGLIEPIQLPAPDGELSRHPGNGAPVYSSYTLVVEHPEYQLAVFEEIQIFAGIETVQDVPLIPLSPNGRTVQDTTIITPQPL